MPAKDIYHEPVKKALINDGWRIIADPFIIKYKDAELYADLAAEQIIAAELQGKRIVVEIKSFLGKSPMTDFHHALGQYIVYRNLLHLTDPDYQVFLAIDHITYKELFQRPSIQVIINQNNLNLLIVNMSQEIINQWIP